MPSKDDIDQPEALNCEQLSLSGAGCDLVDALNDIDCQMNDYSPGPGFTNAFNEFNELVPSRFVVIRPFIDNDIFYRRFC